MVLAEITPDQHFKSKTFFEYQNLKRHWITSFALVEHDTRMTGFAEMSSHGFCPV